jgi:hypothetical protein
MEMSDSRNVLIMLHIKVIVRLQVDKYTISTSLVL